MGGGVGGVGGVNMFRRHVLSLKLSSAGRCSLRFHLRCVVSFNGLKFFWSNVRSDFDVLRDTGDHASIGLEFE